MRYAVRHEYAQTAVDVIARRTRLSFLNAQAALDALPRVVDIMSEELGWSFSRKRKEMSSATEFLQSMGLPKGAVVPQVKPRGLAEKAESAFWWGLSGGPFGFGGSGKPVVLHSRAQFEVGEIDLLRALFSERAGLVTPSQSGGTGSNEQPKLRIDDVKVLLRDTPGYEGLRSKDFDYVLEQAGLGTSRDLDFDEFVEVSLSSQVSHVKFY